MCDILDNSLIFYYFLGTVLVLGLSFVIYLLFTYYDLNVSARVLYIILICSVYMFIAQLLRYWSLHLSVDFSHWAQLIYSISATGKPFVLSQELLVPGTINYLSVHFSPLVYALAIPFKVWPFSETIITLNFLLMMSAAIPMYKLALICQGNKRFALHMVVFLLWYPTFQYVVMYEFEMLRFSIPIILWMLYYFEKSNMPWYYFFAFLAVLVREEVGLTIMMFGIYLLIVKKQRRAGLVTALLGFCSFIVITQMIMPALRGGDGYQHIAMSAFRDFGNSAGDIIINIVKNPLLVLRTVLQPIRLANTYMYFLPLLFIPFLVPAVLISILASFGIGLLSKPLTYVSFMLYYMSPAIPFIFYGLIKAWPKFLAMLEAFHKSNYRIKQRNNMDSAAMATVLSSILVANIIFGPSIISLQFWFKDLRPAPFRTQDFHYSAYKFTDHHRLSDEFCKLIPESAVVSASQFLYPQLFKKRGTMSFPQLVSSDGALKANYVIFDKTNNGLKRNSPAYLNQGDFDLVERDTKNWNLVRSKDGYFLYKNKNIQFDP